MTPSRRFKDMVWVPEGAFLMGSADFYPEEGPVHRVSVGGFWMDEHAVAVAEYRRFVRATGYLTVAERARTPPITRVRHPRFWSRDRSSSPSPMAR